MQVSASTTLASPARRLGAYVLDGIYSFLAMFVLGALVPSDGVGGVSLTLLLIGYVVVGLYFWTQGTSPGKMTLGMYVYSRRTGERLGFWGMFLREMVGKWISGLFLGLGYLWILFDPQNQGWHDKLVDSVVLERS